MSAKRLRAPTAKPGQLKAQWGRLPHNGPDLCYAWGDGCHKADSHLLHNALCAKTPPSPLSPNEPWLPSLLEELEARGYDITTLRFSISKKEVSRD